MTVASDPTPEGKGSTQVRQKGKVLKALTGDETIYFGDHVELSDNGTDFASTIGVGGLVGSNFVMPELRTHPPEEGEPDTKLTAEREKIWQKWIPIAKAKRLWQGKYLGGLYDIGLDKPEGHVVKKGKSLYYAFYADSWNGKIELRGLRPGIKYRLFDYVENRSLGTASGPKGQLEIKFSNYLLLEAIPES